MIRHPLRIGIVGTPSQPAHEWTPDTMHQLRELGFNAVQLNIAWSYRPEDETLNLEDILVIEGAPPSLAAHYDDATEHRLDVIRHRARLASGQGLRTLLHLGLPFQGRAGFDGTPLPQCISDPTVLSRYQHALRALAENVPELDDLLIYTYDQDAWLCSEFGGCDRCYGRPLPERVTSFLNRLASTWCTERLDGRLWWEPWELSAGQALASIPLLQASTTGLMLHSNVGEVITTAPADQFVQNASTIAQRYSIPVVIEVFLSSSNEEVEPWTHLPVPLVTLHQLRTVEALPGIVGVKEYFGLQMNRLDVNLRAASHHFSDPALSDTAVLQRVADEFEMPWLAKFWSIASEAYRLYPWDSSWFARQLGRSEPLHELTAATVRGTQTAASEWDTPAWRSSRQAVFMRTDASEPSAWLLEDVELRCTAAANRMSEALEEYERNRVASADAEVGAHLRGQYLEATGFVTRTRAYSLHIRATLLARLLREAPNRPELLGELDTVLRADIVNRQRELGLRQEREACGSSPVGDASDLQKSEKWVVPERTAVEDAEIALAALREDPDRFLARYLLPASGTASAGQFSLTSR
jgi:hypothetical protein